jgi:hypothetical protein
MVLWQSLRFDQLANKVVGVVIWMITDHASSATAIAGHYYVSVIEIGPLFNRAADGEEDGICFERSGGFRGLPALHKKV